MIRSTPAIARADMIRCALCDRAPCDEACGKLNPAERLRNIWFGNEQTAAQSLPAENPCLTCKAPCEQACVRPGEVPVRDLINRLYYQVKPECETALPETEDRLKCDLCGIPLENPFLLSSSVVASTYDMCARAFEAGWAGICFKTICSLDIHEASPRFSAITGNDGSIIGFKNIEQLSDHSVAENMEIFRRLKEKYPTKFILASIMGRDEAEWGELARQCEENGADAVELNFSCPNMTHKGTGSDIGQSPELVEQYTAAARRGASIPILAKLTPNTATMSEAGEAALRGGADGLSAINTIKSLINPNLEKAEDGFGAKVAVGGFSGTAVKPIALRFIAELAQNPLLKGMHLSGIGGIETWRDALDFIVLGAGTVQVTTAIMQYGQRIVREMKEGLILYMKRNGFAGIEDMRGMMLPSVVNVTELPRDVVIYPRFLHKTCVGCGRCYISCRDGGHQAIRLGDDRKPGLDASRCVGCHLCVMVCPTGSIVSSGKAVAKKKNG